MNIKRSDRNKKSVAIVANSSWNIYNFRQNVIAKFLEEGFQVYVLCLPGVFTKFKDNFPEISYIPVRSLKRKSTNPFSDIFLAVDYYTIYKEIKPDIIIHYTHKPNIFGGLAAKMLGIPSVANITGLGYAFLHNGWIEFMIKKMYKYTSFFHKKFIFENNEDREYFIDLGLIDKTKGVSIKGCGVNINHFTPTEKDEKNSKFIFTFIGRLLYDKGLVEFIDAAKLVLQKRNNICFWIIGDIDHGNPSAISEDELLLLIQNNEGIKYFGFKNNIKTYIKNSDCIVQPSYREAISRAISESMAMEKLVIAANTPGSKEAIDDGINGFLVPVKDSFALAESMEKVLNLPTEVLEEMGRKAREKALADFDDRKIAEQIFQIVNNVLEESSNA